MKPSPLFAPVLVLLCTLLLVPAFPVTASTKHLRVENLEQWSKGEPSGIRIDERGITPGPRWNRTRSIPSPQITDCLVLDDMIYLATADEGKILSVFNGEVTVAARANEPIITALAGWDKKHIYAATNPGGRIYRLTGDHLTEVTHVEGEIRSMTTMGNRLYIGTASPATIMRLEGGNLKAVTKVDDEGVICMAPDTIGNLWAGTIGRGLLLKLDAKERLHVLWQDNLEEISQVAPGEGGRVYFLADSSRADKPKKKEKKKKDTSSTPSTSSSQALSRLAVWNPGGSVQTLMEPKDEILLSLSYLPSLHSPLVGTAAEGKLYTLREEHAILTAKLEDEAIAHIRPELIITGESAAIYRISRKGAHTYTSRIFDAKLLSHFGQVRTLGSGRFTLTFRSGRTDQVGPTWTDWSHPCTTSPCTLHLTGRHAQFRAVLEEKARLEALDWAYTPLNLPPKIESFKVLGPGVVFLKTSYQPQNVVIEATNPDKYGIFTTISHAPNPVGNSKGKEVFMKGYRTFAWKVSDPNGDEIRTSLDYRRKGSQKWRAVFREKQAALFSWDTMVLPDGIYRFRLSATDAPANPEGIVKNALALSPPVVVDNHPPVITFQSKGSDLHITVRDASSPITKGEISVDGQPWRSVEPDDGIFDAPVETFTLHHPGEEVTVRAMDAFYNVVTDCYPSQSQGEKP